MTSLTHQSCFRGGRPPVVRQIPSGPSLFDGLPRRAVLATPPAPRPTCRPEPGPIPRQGPVRRLRWHGVFHLIVLLTVTVTGCYSPRDAGTSAGVMRPRDAARVQSWVEGESRTIRAGAVDLTELPPGSAMLADPPEAGGTLPAKAVSALVGRWTVPDGEVTVRVTPSVDERGAVTLLAVTETRDVVEWRVPRRHAEYLLSAPVATEPRLVIFGRDGALLSGFERGWCLFVALAGTEGVIGWSGAVNDEVAGALGSGFRRFAIEGPAGREGRSLLRAVPPSAR